MPQIKSLLRNVIPRLQAAGCDTPRLDAEVLLAYLLACDRSWLYAHDNEDLPEATVQRYEALVQRRIRREPVAYIIGQREFFGLTFEVTPAVLIPRPETELLVEHALALAPNTTLCIADIGTGSGCIAVSLAYHLPQANLIATDVSAAALTVAKRNALRHGVADRITFSQGNLLESLSNPVDMLVSNPPYIAQDEMACLAPEVTDYEPHLALTDSGSGVALIEQLLSGAPAVIKSGGWLLVEFGASQGAEILRLANSCCLAARFRIVQDLAGRDRLLLGYF